MECQRFSYSSGENHARWEIFNDGQYGSKKSGSRAIRGAWQSSASGVSVTISWCIVLRAGGLPRFLITVGVGEFDIPGFFLE